MAGLPDKTLRIVLVGKTGIGKSATANTILGREEFASKIGPHSVTKECQKAERQWKGRKLLVVDTPGLFDTRETLETTCEEISKCAILSFPGPHAIILVLPLSCYSEEDKETVTMIKAIFGESAMNHMIVLFTRKDSLGDQTLNSFLAGADIKLKNIVKECGNRCCAFNNRSADEAEKEAQLGELVELIEEMVQTNGGAHFSEAIYKEVEKRLQRKEEALKIIYDDQLRKETTLAEEQYAEGKISLQEMEERKKCSWEKYRENIQNIREEAKSNIFEDIKKWIWNMFKKLNIFRK